MTTRDNTEEQRLQMATRLRGAREYIGLSQDDVASALQLSRPAVTNIESGARKVEATELDKLARLYRQSVSYLLTGEDSVGAAPAHMEFLARTLKGLSPRDVDEVARFADFLKRSAKTKPSSKRGK